MDTYFLYYVELEKKTISNWIVLFFILITTTLRMKYLCIWLKNHVDTLRTGLEINAVFLISSITWNEPLLNKLPSYDSSGTERSFFMEVSFKIRPILRNKDINFHNEVPKATDRGRGSLFWTVHSIGWNKNVQFPVQRMKFDGHSRLYELKVYRLAPRYERTIFLAVRPVLRPDRSRPAIQKFWCCKSNHSNVNISFYFIHKGGYYGLANKHVSEITLSL